MSAGPQAVRALEDVVPVELAADPDFVARWTPGFQTNAMVAVELPATDPGSGTTVRQVAPVRRNAGNLHAEEVGVAQGDLRWALAQALEAGTPARPAVVRVLVNRTPCTGCAQVLASQLDDITTRLTPEQRASVRFELLASGAYEATEQIPPEEAHLHTAQKLRFTDAATTTRSIQVLLEAGWDPRALERGGTLSERGEWFAGAVDYMREHLGLPPAGAAPAQVAVAAGPSGAAARGEPAAPPSGHISAILRGNAAPSPPDRIAAILRGEAASEAAGTATPEQRGGALPPPGPPVGTTGAPVAGGDPWEDLQAAARSVPSPDSTRAMLQHARALRDQAARLAATPDPVAPAQAVAQQVRQARRVAFDAATVAYGAATAGHDAYGAAYQAAQLAARGGGPAAADAVHHAGTAHAVAQQLDAQYQAALAANAAAQQSPSPGAVQQAAAHAEQAASLAVHASDAAGRAVAAAGQALGAPGRGAAPAAPSSPAYPALVGDVVFRRTDQVGPAERAAVERALADLVETRTYGNGFTVRLRSVQISPDRTVFEVVILQRGRDVGLARRTLQRAGDTLFVTHNLLDLGPARAQGFGRDWNDHLERWYRASGVDHIKLHATRAGAYVWAQLGYRWVDESQARAILDHLHALVESPDETDITPSEAATARALLDRARSLPWGHEEFPRIKEIADIGRGEPRPGRDHLGRRVLTLGWDGWKDLR